MFIRIIGVTSMLALLTACGGTMQGAKHDMGMASSAPTVQKPATPSNYNRHPIPTTLEEDRMALDQADQRADDQAVRSKKVRHDAADRVIQAKADQADRNAHVADAKVDRAQHNLDVAKQEKDASDAQRNHSNDPVVASMTQSQIADRLTQNGYSNISLTKVTDAISDHTVYSGSALKDGAMKTFRVDETAHVTDLK